MGVPEMVAENDFFVFVQKCGAAGVGHLYLRRIGVQKILEQNGDDVFPFLHVVVGYPRRQFRHFVVTV